MKKINTDIPVYSLDQFRHANGHGRLFQVEVFDANRHFQVQYPHRHDFYEVLYLSGGSGYHIIDSNRYKINPPCIFFMSPGQTHRLELSNDIEGFIFLFAADFYLLNKKDINKLLEFPFFFAIEQENPPLNLSDKTDHQFIRNLFIKACKEIEKESGSEEIIRAILDLLLLTCKEIYPEEYIKIPKSKGHILVKKFLLLIEENFTNNLRVNDYAQKLAISPNHLTQVVKQITGKTTIEILQEKILLEVKRLLVHTNLTVSEISDRLNFVDQSYFTKYFKKKTGRTPVEYRLKSMKNT